MPETPSTMLPLGTPLPAFSLPDFNGRTHSDQELRQTPALLVAFLCPHCPFVKHIRHELARFASDYRGRGLEVVGINSNVASHPDDDLAKMKKEAEAAGYAFPYLADESQSIAKLFQAACTPDFFLFGPDRRLVYRGQFDDSRPSRDTPVTGASVRAAVDALIAGTAVPAVQRPSVGCNIKWKAGTAPDFAR